MKCLAVTKSTWRTGENKVFYNILHHYIVIIQGNWKSKNITWGRGWESSFPVPGTWKPSARHSSLQKSLHTISQEGIELLVPVCVSSGISAVFHPFLATLLSCPALPRALPCWQKSEKEHLSMCYSGFGKGLKHVRIALPLPAYSQGGPAHARSSVFSSLAFPKLRVQVIGLLAAEKTGRAWL